MAIERCYKIMIKIMKYVIRFNFPKNLVKKQCVKFNGKMEVFLKEMQTDYVGLEDARCFEFQVICLGPHSHEFGLRHFLKVSTQDKSFFHEMENKLGSPCLRILLAVNGEKVLYSVHLPEPDAGWTVQTEEIDEKVQRNSCVTIALKIPLSTADLQTVEDAIVQYLKKVLLLHPTFCVSCHSRDNILFRSRHLEQVKSATTWLGQLKTYCRVYGECDETTNFGRTTRRRNNNLPDVTVLYACSTNITKGKPPYCEFKTDNNCGIHAHSGTDMKVKCEKREQQKGETRTNMETQKDKKSLHIFIFCHLLITDRDNKSYIQICDMTAAAVGSVLRFSLNNGFRNQCYELLQTSCTAEAEVKFREMLSNTVTNVKQAMNAVQERDDTQERKNSVEKTVPVMSQAVSLSPSPHASDLTDEEQFFNWDSPQNLLESPCSPSLISNRDLPHPNTSDLFQSLACEPKENEEMQANRNVVEMSQTVSLSSSPNASDLTDEEKFLNWDSPHNDLPPESHRAQCPQNNSLLEDVKTFPCADHKISSISSVSTKDLMDDELFFDWETSERISVQLEE